MYFTKNDIEMTNKHTKTYVYTKACMWMCVLSGPRELASQMEGKREWAVPLCLDNSVTHRLNLFWVLSNDPKNNTVYNLFTSVGNRGILPQFKLYHFQDTLMTTMLSKPHSHNRQNPPHNWSPAGHLVTSSSLQVT